MKAMWAIVGAALVILMMGAVLAAIDGFRSTSYTEQHIQSTGGGDTSVNVVLANAVYGDTTVNISVSSNDTDDAPVPFTYVSATKQLTISGLAVSTSHLLTVVYRTGSLARYPAADLFASYWPAFLGMAIVGIVVGSIVNAFKGRG